MARLRAGMTPSEVAAQLQVPVETVRAWAGGRVPRAARQVLDGRGQCSGCGAFHGNPGPGLPGSSYAYVLAVYLGDGCVSEGTRTHRLQVSLDSAYPDIIECVRTAVGEVRGRLPHVAATDRGYTAVTSYWREWPCHLPQHGAGKKHHRPIELADWQWDIVREHPEPFLRGLIHTDGWRGLNRVTVKGRRYEYPRYQFSNRSDDIRQLFCDACDLIGVEWRPWGRWHVSVARRESVARLDEFIGPKA